MSYVDQPTTADYAYSDGRDALRRVADLEEAVKYLTIELNKQGIVIDRLLGDGYYPPSCTTNLS